MRSTKLYKMKQLFVALTYRPFLIWYDWGGNHGEGEARYPHAARIAPVLQQFGGGKY